MHFKGVVSD